MFRISETVLAHADVYAQGVARRTRRARVRRAVALRLLILRGLAAADAGGLASPARSFADDGPTAAHLLDWRAVVAASDPVETRASPLLEPIDAPTAEDLRNGIREPPLHRLCVTITPTLVRWIDRFRVRLAEKHPDLVVDRAAAVETLLRWGLREEARHGPDGARRRTGSGPASRTRAP